MPDRLKCGELSSHAWLVLPSDRRPFSAEKRVLPLAKHLLSMPSSGRADDEVERTG